MVSSPHTPQPVISTANITTTNPNTPVSTVAAGPHTPSPAVASPAACLDGSNLSNDGAKKPEEISAEDFSGGDPTEEVCGVVIVGGEGRRRRFLQGSGSKTCSSRLQVDLKGKWQPKFLLRHLKETLKIIYRSLLHNFYICFTLGDIVT